MQTRLILLGLLLVGATGCCSGPVCTHDIYFYCDPNPAAGGQLHYAVDVIYPKDQAQLDQVITTIGPQKWFTSDLYTQVHKDKVWLDPGSVQHIVLVNKVQTDPYMVIFAEFEKPDLNPARGREPYLLYKADSSPKARKVEYIGVHEGSLERLNGKPSNFR